MNYCLTTVVSVAMENEAEEESFEVKAEVPPSRVFIFESHME